VFSRQPAGVFHSATISPPACSTLATDGLRRRQASSPLVRRTRLLIWALLHAQYPRFSCCLPDGKMPIYSSLVEYQSVSRGQWLSWYAFTRRKPRKPRTWEHLEQAAYPDMAQHSQAVDLPAHNLTVSYRASMPMVYVYSTMPLTLFYYSSKVVALPHHLPTSRHPSSTSSAVASTYPPRDTTAHYAKVSRKASCTRRAPAAVPGPGS